MIDEKIADLETLRNPTVGLAAHTGVVDVRIAAKAKTESEADAMIAEVEAQVRERLGNVVFGADDDKLEVRCTGSSGKPRVKSGGDRVRIGWAAGAKNPKHRLHP
jgi:hypothetical protein